MHRFQIRLRLGGRNIQKNTSLNTGKTFTAGNNFAAISNFTAG